MNTSCSVFDTHDCTVPIIFHHRLICWSFSRFGFWFFSWYRPDTDPDTDYNTIHRLMDWSICFSTAKHICKTDGIIIIYCLIPAWKCLKSFKTILQKHFMVIQSLETLHFYNMLGSLNTDLLCSKCQWCGRWRWSAWVRWPSLSVWSCFAGSSVASDLEEPSMRSSSFPQRWPVWSISSLPRCLSRWNLISELSKRKLYMIYTVSLSSVVIMATIAKIHSP